MDQGLPAKDLGEPSSPFTKVPAENNQKCDENNMVLDVLIQFATNEDRAQSSMEYVCDTWCTEKAYTIWKNGEHNLYD